MFLTSLQLLQVSGNTKNGESNLHGKDKMSETRTNKIKETHDSMLIILFN